MAAITRLGLEGYGVRRAGSFADKSTGGDPPDPPTGKAPIFTRRRRLIMRMRRRAR